jgi:hypothetical protein
MIDGWASGVLKGCKKAPDTPLLLPGLDCMSIEYCLSQSEQFTGYIVFGWKKLRLVLVIFTENASSALLCYAST